VAAATVNVAEGAALLEVQRPDGVARMITYKLPHDTVLALAKALGAP